MTVGTELVAEAVEAIDRIMTEPSGLLDLWNEGDEAGAWRDAVADLGDRVAG